jgi:Kef-type K+ transport system membrane component KefB
MTDVWALASLWLFLALVATLLSIWLDVATALSEVVVGTVAHLLIGVFVGKALLGTSRPWITFLSGTGAIVLTVLAGAELDPAVLRSKWKETAGIGLVGFFAPFLGCAAFALGHSTLLPALRGTAFRDSEPVPFYFIRAGSFVSVPALVAAPARVLGLLLAKLVTKTIGVWPITRLFRYPRQEAAYTTLLMSTGLTFGSISALFGLTHGVIDQTQYSLLIAAVIGSAVVPTLIANAFFLPRYLLPRPAPAGETTSTAVGEAAR